MLPAEHARLRRRAEKAAAAALTPTPTPLRPPHHDAIVSLEPHPNDATLAVATDEKLELLTLPDATDLHRTRHNPKLLLSLNSANPLTALRWSPLSPTQLVCAYSTGGQLSVYDVCSSPRASLPLRALRIDDVNGVSCVAVAESAPHLVLAGGRDGELRAWDLRASAAAVRQSALTGGFSLGGRSTSGVRTGALNALCARSNLVHGASERGCVLTWDVRRLNRVFATTRLVAGDDSGALADQSVDDLVAHPHLDGYVAAVTHAGHIVVADTHRARTTAKLDYVVNWDSVDASRSRGYYKPGGKLAWLFEGRWLCCATPLGGVDAIHLDASCRQLSHVPALSGAALDGTISHVTARRAQCVVYGDCMGRVGLLSPQPPPPLLSGCRSHEWGETVCEDAHVAAARDLEETVGKALVEAPAGLLPDEAPAGLLPDEAPAEAADEAPERGESPDETNGQERAGRVGNSLLAPAPKRHRSSLSDVSNAPIEVASSSPRRRATSLKQSTILSFFGARPCPREV